MSKQYCRYCSHAEDYNGERTDFVCLADAPCGGDGSGIFYSATKAKAVNHCRHFAFCGIDIFTDREYQPREKREKISYVCDYEQLSLL